MPARGSSAKRYAQAVFEIAQEADRFDQWQDDLDSLAEAAANAEFVALVENPRLAVEEKRKIVADTLPGISDGALNLATILMVKGRFRVLAPLVAEEFRRLMDGHHGILRADVVTAVELTKDRVDQLTKALAEATGKDVRVTQRVDPEIVGGMVVRVGDRVLDGSVQSTLRGLRRSLVEDLA